jgi:hypothetical protein
MPKLHNDKELLNNTITGLHVDQDLGLSASLDGDGFNVSAGTVFSFWFKRDINSNSGVVLGTNTGTDVPCLWGIRVGDWQATAGNSDMDNIQINTVAENQNSGYQHVWSGATIRARQELFNKPQLEWSDWNHFLIYQSSASGGFGATFNTALYVNGLDISSINTSGPNVYQMSTALPSPFNIGWNQPTGRTVGTFAAVARGARDGNPTGCVGQVWIGVIPPRYDSGGNLTSFKIEDFYNSGFVDLGGDGTQGATQTLPRPRFYNKCDYPFTGITPRLNGNVTTVSQSFNCYNY